MLGRLMMAALVVSTGAPAFAFEEPMPCTTANLLAQKSFVEAAAVKVDACNRSIAAQQQWITCDLPSDTPDRMPWVSTCLNQRLASALSEVDAFDPRTGGAADILTLQHEVQQLTSMKDSWLLYLRRFTLYMEFKTIFAKSVTD